MKLQYLKQWLKEELDISLKLLRKEVFKVPNLFHYLGYTVFFWSNENFEPIHVHICTGSPTANATKVWITNITYVTVVLKTY